MSLLLVTMETVSDEPVVSISFSIKEGHRVASTLEEGARRDRGLANGPKPMHPDDAQSLRVSASLADKTAETLRALAMEALQDGR